MNDRQRLEAIVAVVCKYLPPDGISREEAMSQIIGLVDPLPAQPEQEPVAWMAYSDWGNIFLSTERKGSFPVYTAPPKREWVGLTIEEIKEMLYGLLDDDRTPMLTLIDAVQEKLKEKNGD